MSPKVASKCSEELIKAIVLRRKFWKKIFCSNNSSSEELLQHVKRAIYISSIWCNAHKKNNQKKTEDFDWLANNKWIQWFLLVWRSSKFNATWHIPHFSLYSVWNLLSTFLVGCKEKSYTDHTEKKLSIL